MRFGHTVTLYCTLLAIVAVAGAQTPASDAANRQVVIGERIVVHSTKLGEDREAIVALPSGYQSGAERYPVLYVLDGEENIVTAVSAVRFLASAGRIPEMIVVAIVNRDRLLDFTPPLHRTPSPPREVERAGGSGPFIAFLGDELIPRIDSAYRTRPLRVLVGHSLGGLLAIQSFVTRPSLFRRYVTVDPSLWWDAGDVVDSARAAATRYSGPVIRFAAVRGDSANVATMFGSARAVRATIVPVANESHEYLMYRGLYDGLTALFSDYVPRSLHDLSYSSLGALRSQYDQLSAEFGYDVPVPLSALLQVANHEARQRRFAQAYAALDEAARVYPSSRTVGAWRRDVQAAQKSATEQGLLPTKTTLRFTPVSAAVAATLLGHWAVRMYSDSPEFQDVLGDATFELHGDTLVYDAVAHGVAFDGGDFKDRASIVEMHGDTLRWERENSGGGLAVTTAELKPDGTIAGREEMEQSEPLPAGFSPPQAYVKLERTDGSKRKTLLPGRLRRDE